jgi:Dolichyl-phosphate-mannose-protein mannosyltransferase
MSDSSIETLTVEPGDVGGSGAVMPHRRKSELLLSLGVAGIFVATGVIILAWLDHGGGTAQNRPLSNLYWVAICFIFLPLLLLAAWRRLNELGRVGVVLVLGIMSVVPKMMISWGGPVMFDEKLHYRQLVEIANSGRLFQSNLLIPQAKSYPGLEALTTTVAKLGNLGLWRTSQIIILFAHVVALLLLREVALQFGLSPRGAAVAAGIYAVSPQFLYFDTQFAYETLALCLLLGTLAIFLRLAKARRRSSIWALALAELAVGGATIVTHHVTALFMVAILWILTGCGFVRSRFVERPKSDQSRVPQSLVPLIGTTVGLSTWLVLWFVYLSPGIFQYIFPTTRTYAPLAPSKGVHPPGGGFFAGSSYPVVVQMAAYATFVIAAVACLVVVVALLRGRLPQLAFEPLLGAAAYFGVLGLDFVGIISGESAHRSWAVSYMFVAIVIAAMVTDWWDQARKGWPSGLERVSRVASPVLLVAIAVVLILGNIASGNTPDELTNGPFIFGSDSRGTNNETLALVRWMQNHIPPRTGVIADRYAGAEIFAYTDLYPTPVGQYPLGSLYYTTLPVSENLMHTLDSRGYRYLLVDNRLAHAIAPNSYPVQPAYRYVYASPAALEKFNHLPWTKLVYRSTHYSLYRIDYRALGELHFR